MTRSGCIRVKVKSGSWAGSVGKVLNTVSESTLLMQLENHKKIRVEYKNIEILPREKQVMPERSIGHLDFSNPYTLEDEE
jgi:hypothetical protein